VQIPVSADIEHGYAPSPDGVAEIVLRVMAAGAIGVNIEDCVPGAKALEPIDVQADKIHAVVSAASTAGIRIVVNARTDVFLRQVGDPPDRLIAAIARAKAYRAEGADCVFVPGVNDAPTIAALVNGIGGAVNILAGPGTPPIPELERLGVARVTFGSGPMRAALALTREIALELRDRGTYAALTERTLSYDEANELMRSDAGSSQS
jgi:2-methylisocitrate lyase-like PEP mutase family enzyme